MKTTYNYWLLGGVFLMLGSILPSATYGAMSIDTTKVEQTRLQWTNDLRASQNLAPYEIDARLTATASERSKLAQQRGYLSHERKKGDGYYNYKKIEQWFGARKIFFVKKKRATFSESIGRGYVSCRSDDCTDAVIEATKSTWQMYMREKNKKSQPHYRALIHSQFTMMGVGIVFDEKTKKYFLTVHYATGIKN